MPAFLKSSHGIFLNKTQNVGDVACWGLPTFWKDFDRPSGALLTGKVALITGTNRGIGCAILKEFAKNGAFVFAHARKESPEFESFLKDLAQQYSANITPIYFDLADVDAIKKGVHNMRKMAPYVDVLVNNAGITLNKLFLMTTVSDITWQMDVNFKAMFVLSQYVAKCMQKKGGSIINISSVSAKGGDCGRALYGASKAAVESLTKTMAQELGQHNIRVNAIAPGFIETDMMSVISEDAIARNLNLSKLKRIGRAEEVANTALFLATEWASYITSEVIHVDGGLKG